MSSTKEIIINKNTFNNILQKHNLKRMQLFNNDNNMLLKLDNELNKQAQSYANQLASSINNNTLKHSKCNDYGENLYCSSNLNGDPSYAVDAWLNEESDYFKALEKYNNTTTTPLLSFSGYGHYTQCIWPNTKLLGIGIANSKNYQYVVCQYKPAGNIIGQLPYTNNNNNND